MGNSQPKKPITDSLGEPDVSNDDYSDYSDDAHEQPEEDVSEQVEPEEDVSEQVEPEEDVSEQVEPEEDVSEQVEPEEDVSDQPAEQIEIPLSSIPVNDKNGAFQLLIAFINLAYARGAFKQDEVEKIIECINKFVV